MSLKRQIISASSHPAELSVTLSFNDKDFRIWGSLVLNKGDMELVYDHIAMTRKNYKPWIMKNFECIDDRTWECKKCHRRIVPIEENGEIKGVVELMDAHRLTHGEKL